MINNIRRLITVEENKEMERLADEREVKNVVFDLNGNSACGPDGFTRELFQSCWDIVRENITRIVKTFFCG